MNDIRRGSTIKVGARLSVPERGNGKSNTKGRKKADRQSDRNSSVVRNKEIGKAVTRSKESGNSIVRSKESGNSIARGKESNLVSSSQDNLTSAARKPFSRAARALAGSTRIHVVKAGDTLIEIARRYNISIGRLVTQNNLRNRSKVLVGRALIVSN